MSRIPIHAIVVLALTSCGCTGFEMDEEEPCNDAGYGISARVFSCTDDHDAANDAYELFDETYQCNVAALKDIKNNQGVNAMFECSRRLNELTCEQVNAAGGVDVGDLEGWVSAQPACQQILVR